MKDQFICGPQSVLLDPGQGQAYNWINTEGIDDTNARTQVVQPEFTTTYRVEVLDECGNISRTDEVTVFVDEEASLNLGSDTVLCEGEILELSPTYENGSSFLWNTGAQTPEILVSQSGTYSLQIASPICPTVRDSIQVTFSDPNPDFLYSPDPDFEEVVLGEPIGFSSISTEPGTYIWSIPELGQTLEGREIFLAFSEPGSYEVELTVIDEYDLCSASKIDNINVQNGNLYVPNAFTPNGDGINDIFFVEGFGIAQAILIIKNRWGKILFQSESTLQGWDGTDTNGVQQPEGVYAFVYAGIFRSGTPFQRVGTVTLGR